MIGSVLAHYEIEALLGAGGMGVVYRAYDQKLRRQVAIKFLGDSTEIETRARLFREARAASALNHPNICTIYEVGEAEGRTYIVMEYVQGTLLSTLIPPGGLAPEAFSRYSLQIADAVKHAHANNVVHRDLKSGNIIVTSDGRAKVLDFGLANRMPGLGDDRATQSASITTSPEPVAGTLAYMPPEVLDGAPADFKGDVWSLGVLLYEMAAGEHPFKGARGLQLIAAIVGDRPIPPLRTGIHTAQKSVVERCLERDPKWRFEHAGAVHAALEGAATRWRGRGTTMVAATAILIASVAAGTAYWQWTLARRTATAATGGANAVVPAATTTRRTVAVLGFKNLSGRPAAAWLSTALSEMLTTELAAGEQVRAIPGENVARMKSDLALGDAESFAPETLARIRSNIGSDLVVLGSYVVVGEKIRFDVRMQDAALGQTVALVAETGAEDDLLELISRIGLRLRDELGVAGLSAAEAATLQASRPANPAAARLYAEGLAKLRLYDAQAAGSLFDRAVAADPKHALTHSGLAATWSQLGYDERAKNSARRAFELSANLTREDRLLVEGRYHQAMNQHLDAVKTYQTLYGFFPDNLEYGLQLASAQTEGGRASDALATIESLRKLRAPIADDPRIDLAEAAAAAALSDFKQQQVAASRAAAKGQAQGARLLVASARIQEWAAWQSLGERAKAIAAAEEARQIYAAAGDRGGESRALRSVGIVLRARGDLAGARRTYDQALAVSREIGDQGLTAGLLNNIANVLRQEGSIDQAKQTYAAALAIFREVGDQSAVALILNNNAIALRVQGDLQGARANYAESLAIRRTLGEKAGVAVTLNNLANVVSDEGRLAEATKMYEESLAINQEVGDKLGIARAWFNIAEMVRLQGDLPRARTLLDQAVALRRASEDKSGVAQTLVSIGMVLTAQGRLPEARQAYQEALAVQESIGEKREIARSNTLIARVALYEGRFKEAEAMARQAAGQLREQKLSEDEARALAGVAGASLALKQIRSADEATQRAVGLIRGSQSRHAGFEVSLAAARVDAARGRHGPAVARLTRLLADAKGYLEYEFAARLALGEAEIASGRAGDGRARLETLQKDATAKGFLLVARQSAGALATRPASGSASR